MKKSVKFLLPFLVINSALLFGCEKDKDKKTLLTYGDMNYQAEKLADNSEVFQYELTYDELKAKMDDKKENFLVAVSTSQCGCWNAFAATLKDYIQETHVIVYKIKYTEFKNKDSLGIKLTAGSTSFAIIKDGKVALTLCSDKDDDTMDDTATFKAMMEKAVILPKMYYISINDYKQKFQENALTSGVIYFKRSECGDCKEAEPSILKPYFESHKDSKRIYVVDIQPIWASQGQEGYDNYLEEKIALGLASNENVKFGYNGGVVPSFIYIEHGEYKSGAVAYNDTIEKVGDKYVVTDSYYTTERIQNLGYNAEVIKGKEIPEADLKINSYGASWKYDKANEYHKKNVTNFLDYALANSISIL